MAGNRNEWIVIGVFIGVIVGGITFSYQQASKSSQEPPKIMASVVDPDISVTNQAETNHAVTVPEVVPEVVEENIVQEDLVVTQESVATEGVMFEEKDAPEFAPEVRVASEPVMIWPGFQTRTRAESFCRQITLASGVSCEVVNLSETDFRPAIPGGTPEETKTRLAQIRETTGLTLAP